MATARSLFGFIGLLVVALGLTVQGFAASPAASVTRARSAVEPRINKRIPSRVRTALETGFELALEKLEQEPACRDLFADLGTEGLEMLSTTMYYQAGLKQEQQLCSRAFAFTTVGGAPTWVCRRFAKLSRRRAAKVLLHEALHHAGMDERPHDPNGLSPSAIDELVEKACGL